MTQETKGVLTTRTVAMPGDTNPAGDIFGGWVLYFLQVFESDRKVCVIRLGGYILENSKF